MPSRETQPPAPCSALLTIALERRATHAGVVHLPPSRNHRVRVHASNPLRGWCGHHCFVYERGELDILPSGYEDTWQEEDAGVSLLIDVSPGLLGRAAEECGIGSHETGLELRHQIRDAQIEHLALALDAHRAEGRPGGLLYEESLGIALALRLVGRHRTPSARVRGLPAQQLRDLQEYIEANIGSALSLQDLSAVAQLSVSHLKTLFKRSTGMPLHAYVMHRRVERARKLLQRRVLPAAEVALEAGFSHQSHMARCMRRLLGLTPSEVASAGGPAAPHEA